MHGVRLGEVMPREDPATVPALLAAVRARFYLTDLVTFEHDRNGNEKVFENSFFGDIKDGKVRSIWGAARDITSEYEAERDNQIKSMALDSMVEGCIVVDATKDDMPIIYVNDRFTGLTGYTREDVMERNCRFLQGPDTDPATVVQIRESIHKEELFEGEILNYRKDGTPFLGELRIVPIRDRKGKVTRCVGSLRDITEERQLARESCELAKSLAHVSRMGTLSELFAAITHEINQPLTAISSNVGAALRNIKAGNPDMQDICEILEDIVADSKRSADVIKGLRKLFKKDVLDTEPLDLAEKVYQTLAIMHADLLLHKVSVKSNLADDQPAIFGDRSQIQQVILNLILNAREAVETLEPERRRIEVQTSHDTERGVQFAVRDYGCGISEENKEKIFEHFFTTKEDGLGLGLAICRKIIEAHGGELWAENNPDQGATFCFVLPVGEGEVESDKCRVTGVKWRKVGTTPAPLTLDP